MGSGSPGFETIVLPDGPHAGRTGWRRTPDPGGVFRVNHTHHTDELYRQARQRWAEQRAEFRRAWQAQDLRRQYQQRVGTIDRDIAAILDGPHGPPLLEDLLSEFTFVDDELIAAAHLAEMAGQSKNPAHAEAFIEALDGISQPDETSKTVQEAIANVKKWERQERRERAEQEQE